MSLKFLFSSYRISYIFISSCPISVSFNLGWKRICVKAVVITWYYESIFFSWIFEYHGILGKVLKKKILINTMWSTLIL